VKLDMNVQSLPAKDHQETLVLAEHHMRNTPDAQIHPC